MKHDHDCHSHGKNAPFRVLMLAIALIFLFALVEAFGGYWAHSLALLGDAGHMGSDALALSLAAFASFVAKKPPSDKHSYGLGRAEVVAAWLSSLLMLGIAVGVMVNAIIRLHTPQAVHGFTVLLIGGSGLIVNLIAAYLLTKSEQTLNMRAALLHVLGDVLGSLAALVAGAVIYATHWYPIDPILSIFISLLILFSSLRLLRESLLILMEGVPMHINIEAVAHSLRQLDPIQSVHDLHIWTLSSGHIALSAHIEIPDFSVWPSVLSNIQQLLKHQYHIQHITLQPEPQHTDCKGC